MVLTLTQAVINGMLIGGVYALIAVGLTLVFGIMDIVNFAQSEFLMMGMFFAYILSRLFGLDPILSSFIVFAMVFFIGAVVQRFFIQKVLNAAMVTQILLTVGISIVMISLAQLIFGANFHSVTTSYQMKALHIGPIVISISYLLAFGGCFVMYFLLWLFLNRTYVGRAIRATAQNRKAAILLGINPDRMFILAFAVGTGMAGVAGAMILPYAYVFPTVGHEFALIMFTVVVLGGFGSVPGALVGGLMVGVIQSVSAILLPTQLQNLVVFIIFILTLTYRPNGLFGR
jgi:branched-chain amino acid transport system permease protein